MSKFRSPLVALVALVLIASACSNDSTSLEVDAADTTTDDSTPEPEATDEPEPTEEPEPEPTDDPEPEPTAEPEPSEESEPEPTEGDAASVFASSMNDDDGLDQLSDEDALCVGLGLVERLGAATVLAMSADDYMPTGDEVAQMVDALYECVPAETIGQAFSAELAADLSDDVTPEALACIEQQYSDRTNIEAVLGIFAENPDAEFDDLPSETQLEVLDPIFSCVGLGAIMAAAAADDGVILSDASIACLDDNGDELLRMILLFDDFDNAPDDVQAEMLQIVFTCLSPAELAEMAN